MKASLRFFLEQRVFGVCSELGDRMKLSSSRIRFFFIYTSFLTMGSPIIIYMILAFWMNMRNYMFQRRTSVWDL